MCEQVSEPWYPEDDGPLTDKQIEAIRAKVAADARERGIELLSEDDARWDRLF